MKSTLSVLLLLLVATLTAACTDSDGGPDPLPAGDDVVVAVGTNYIDTSAFTRIVLPQLYVDENGIDGVASLDPVVRQRGDYLVVINRFGFDNVTILDAHSHELIDQVSTGSGTNPQDVAVIGAEMYVALYGGSGLAVIDLADTSAGATPVDLTSLDPDDQVPNCQAVEVVNGQLWVSCGIRDDSDDFLTPRGPGVIAVVDPDEKTVTSSFELQHAAPTGFFLTSRDGEVYLSTAPDLLTPAGDGCIEAMNAADANSDGCLVENETLGGYAADLEWGKDGIIASVVTGFDMNDYGPNGTVVHVTDLDGDPTVAELGVASTRVFDAAVCPDGQLVLSTVDAGLLILDASNTDLTGGGIDIGAPLTNNGTLCQ